MSDSGKTKQELIRELESIRQRLAGLEQAETRHEQMKELYATLANSSPVGVYIFQEGKFVFVNRQFQNHTGYNEPELLAMAPRELIFPDDRTATRRNAIDMLKGLRESPYEFRVITKAGKIVWAMETLTSITYNGKRASLGNFMDITERKKAEEALRESEARYSALVNLGGRVGEAIIMLQDKNGKNSLQTFVSEEWPNITGYSREELLRMSFLDLLHPKDRADSLKRHKRKIRGEIMPGLFEMTVIRKDGSEVPIEITSAYTSYRGERGNVVFIRDITERKQAEAKLLAYQQELRSLAAELSLAEERERRLIATDLHDHVSQSLAICNIKLGAMLEISPSRQFTTSLKELRSLISQMIKETRSLSFSISSPLLYVFGLDAAVEQFAKDMQEQYGINFHFESSKQLHPLDDDVRVLLYRTVYEIFNNILKHARAHNVRVNMREVNGYLRISIEDDGIGFNTDEMTDNMLKNKGFGLFSVRERLTYIGGEVEIQSQPDIGTRVTIIAPLKQQSQNKVGLEAG